MSSDSSRLHRTMSRIKKIALYNVKNKNTKEVLFFIIIFFILTTDGSRERAHTLLPHQNTSRPVAPKI
jgi:hypothetical protein